MPKKTIGVTYRTDLRAGDTIVKAPVHMGDEITVEREVPLPDVRPGDLVRYYWDNNDHSKNKIEEVESVTDERVTLVRRGGVGTGGWVARVPNDDFPHYEVFRKVEQEES